MAESDSDISHLDFESPKLVAMDYITPCSEGDACVLADKVALATTVLDITLKLRTQIAGLASIIGRHGSPDVANVVFEQWTATYATLRDYLLATAQELEDGAGS